MVTSKSGELTHAYLIAGGAENLDGVYGFLEKHGISVKGNPDVYVREYLAFKIDDARELRERAQTRAVSGGRRVFIAVTPSMTTDAQNALLKVLEEPPAGAVFFFLIPSPQSLLATLRSRAQILSLGGMAVSRVDVKAFLKASPEKRIELLKPLYEKTDDDERDLRGAVTFLAVLEKELEGTHTREGIEAVYRARKYLMDKGALLKPLLEQVALLSPKL